MKTYKGHRTPQGCQVFVYENGKGARRLPLFLGIRNHSPTGFEFGYGGSGPAQLALALVADACGQSKAIAPIYQEFKFAFVAKIKDDHFEITQTKIQAMVQGIEREHHKPELVNQ